MSDKLTTASGVLDWAEWMENTDSRVTRIPGRATAERLALGQRVLAIVERDQKAVAKRNLGPWSSDAVLGAYFKCTLAEAHEVGDE